MFATVSRTSAALNQPKLYKSEELQSMLNLCRTFCAEATQRITSRVQNMNENNDEGIKDAARFAYKENGYKFDVL
jgi:hypothetical protein